MWGGKGREENTKTRKSAGNFSVDKATPTSLLSATYGIPIPRTASFHTSVGRSGMTMGTLELRTAMADKMVLRRNDCGFLVADLVILGEKGKGGTTSERVASCVYQGIDEIVYAQDL